MLFIGALWIVMAAPFLISLLPMGQRLVERLELRLKPGKNYYSDFPIQANDIHSHVWFIRGSCICERLPTQHFLAGSCAIHVIVASF